MFKFIRRVLLFIAGAALLLYLATLSEIIASICIILGYFAIGYSIGHTIGNLMENQMIATIISICIVVPLSIYIFPLIPLYVYPIITFFLVIYAIHSAYNESDSLYAVA